MINTLQLITRIPLFSLPFPSNVQLFFSLLVDVTNFSFLDTEEFNRKVFKFKNEQAFNENFKQIDIF
jgi:hypothetical protein